MSRAIYVEFLFEECKAQVWHPDAKIKIIMVSVITTVLPSFLYPVEKSKLGSFHLSASKGVSMSTSLAEHLPATVAL